MRSHCPPSPSRVSQNCELTLLHVRSPTPQQPSLDTSPLFNRRNDCLQILAAGSLPQWRYVPPPICSAHKSNFADTHTDNCRFEHPSSLSNSHQNQRGSNSYPARPQSHQGRGSSLADRITSSSNAQSRGNHRTKSPYDRANDRANDRGNRGHGRGNNRNDFHDDHDNRGHGRGNNRNDFNDDRDGYRPPPRRSPPQQSHTGFQSQRTGGRGARGGPSARGGPDSNPRHNSRKDPRNRYSLTSEELVEDLRDERPQWLMSCYGPGLDNPPRQLFEGFPLEQSMEEIRVFHYLALAAGNEQASAQNEAELAAMANQQVQACLNDTTGAIEYIVSGEREHPNRDDFVEESNRGHRLGLFSKENQRNHRGVFEDQQPPPPQIFNDERGSQSNQGNHRAGPNGFGSRSNGSSSVGPNGFGSQPIQSNQVSGYSFGGIQPPRQPSAFSAPQNGFGQNMNSGFGSSSQPLQQNGGFNPSLQPSQQNGGFNPSPQPSQQNGGFNISPQPLQNTGGFFGQQSSAPMSAPMSTPLNPQMLNTQTGMFGGQSNPLPSAFALERGRIDRSSSHDIQMMSPTAAGETAAQTNNPELQEAYQYALQHGQFRDGIMPETAPQSSWTRF